MSSPLPKAPDAFDFDRRSLEFYYDGQCQGYVVDEICDGNLSLQIKGAQVREYRIRVMECPDGYHADFKIEIDQLQAWGLPKDTTLPHLVALNSPLSTTRVYALHKTKMVMEILNRMDVGGMRTKAKEAENILMQADPFHADQPQGKRVRFAAFIRKPNGDIIKWPIANNQIGVIVD